MTNSILRVLGQNIFRLLLRLELKKPTRRLRKIGFSPILEMEDANILITRTITSRYPQLISRLGTVEAELVKHFVHNQRRGECHFPEALKESIRINAGVFPAEDELLSRFSRSYLEDLERVDILGIRSSGAESQFWPLEAWFVKNYAKRAKLVDLESLMPMGNPISWTKSLRGKKVLVIHPFSATITQQYEKRRLLFPDFDFLPDCEIEVIRAVQSHGENAGSTGFANWFEATESMSSEIDKKDFDVAIVGAGAYGLPLAAHCKERGKLAIHVGGATQLLFGILGKRWTNPSSPEGETVLPLVNKHWVGPAEQEYPSGAGRVEDGCYWL